MNKRTFVIIGLALSITLLSLPSAPAAISLPAGHVLIDNGLAPDANGECVGSISITYKMRAVDVPAGVIATPQKDCSLLVDSVRSSGPSFAPNGAIEAYHGFSDIFHVRSTLLYSAGCPSAVTGSAGPGGENGWDPVHSSARHWSTGGPCPAAASGEGHYQRYVANWNPGYWFEYGAGGLSGSDGAMPHCFRNSGPNTAPPNLRCFWTTEDERIWEDVDIPRDRLTHLLSRMSKAMEMPSR